MEYGKIVVHINILDYYFVKTVFKNCIGFRLVKVPTYIAQRWEAAADPNQTVAKLTIERVPGKKPIVSLKLDDKMTSPMPDAKWTTTTKGEIPKDHKFVINPVNMQHLAVLSNTRGAGVSGGDKLAVEGRVIQRQVLFLDTFGVVFWLSFRATTKSQMFTTVQKNPSVRSWVHFDQIFSK